MTVKCLSILLLSISILTVFSISTTTQYAKAQNTISIVPGASTMGLSAMMEQAAQPVGPYEPSSLSVKNGTTVTWMNNDSVPHKIASGDPSTGPTGIFESEMIKQGGTFNHTFNTNGMFVYFDTLYPDMVTGTIVVSQNVTQQDESSGSEQDGPSRNRGNNVSDIGSAIKSR